MRLAGSRLISPLVEPVSDIPARHPTSADLRCAPALTSTVERIEEL